MPTLKEDAIILGGAAVVLIVGAWYVKKKAGAVATKTLDAVTPWNPDNIFNQAATGLYQTITGSHGTMGADFYDAIHPSYDQNGRKIINVPGQPGYDPDKTATDMDGDPDRVAGWMDKITTLVWGR